MAVRTFDSSAWTGRPSTSWWWAGFRLPWFAVGIGWSMLHNDFRIQLLAGRVRAPTEGMSRYSREYSWQVARRDRWYR